jgi:TolB-like protein/class 3 adenylate cyclase
MAGEVKKEIQLEIAHVLFIDIVGYSKLSINDQRAAIDELTQAVRASEQFQNAEAAARLLKIPTGDGMALVFYKSPEEPVECALEISRALKEHPKIQIRMGVHSGPVSGVIDVNGQANLAGAGINIAQRVMDCGDAGHILLSKRVADDLGEYEHWRPLLHDLGECGVKHGVRVSIVNVHADEVGNPQLPKKLQALKEHRVRMRWAAATVALLALAAIVTGIAMFSRNRLRLTPSAPEKSIAVLPFESLSEDKANAYFADGIQDEILARLSKITELKVISRTSTQKYKSAPANLREIAQQLDVANILEGSVQKASDTVRITVQLINARNDQHLWSDTYDRKLIDVFQVESDVAQKIAGALEAKLTGGEKAAINSGGTENAQAYEAYLHAVALRTAQSPEDQERGIEFCRQAVDLDPNYAQAWAELAVKEASKYFFPEHTEVQKDRARRAAENALRLAPDLADARGAMGLYYYYCLQDFEGALARLEEARQLAPNDWKLIGAVSLVKRRQGRLDEAITLQLHATQLDPLNEDIWVNLARSYAGVRKFELALNACDRALKIDPKSGDILMQKADILTAKGDFAVGWQMVKDLKFRPNGRAFGDYITMLVFQRRFHDAISLMSSSMEEDKEMSPIFLAISHAALGRLREQVGEHAQGRALLIQAEGELHQILAHDPSMIVFETLLLVEAQLNRREEVERIAKSLLEMIGPDKWQLPVSEETIAQAYSILGDIDRALPLLTHALAAPSAAPLTPVILQLDPVWDPVRSDPRFQKLVASFAPK